MGGRREQQGKGGEQEERSAETKTEREAREGKRAGEGGDQEERWETEEGREEGKNGGKRGGIRGENQNQTNATKKRNQNVFRGQSRG